MGAPLAVTNFTGESEIAVVPFGAPDLPLTCVQLIPPGTALAERMLTNYAAGSGLRTQLRDAWQRRHDTIEHESVPECLARPPGGQPVPRPKLCYRVGFCVCDCDQSVVALGKALRGLLGRVLRKPKTAAWPFEEVV